MTELSPRELDDLNRLNVLQTIEKHPDQKGSCVVCGFTDLMGDGAWPACEKCGAKVSIRPWMLEAAVKHKLKIVCKHCVDPQSLEQAIIQEVAQIKRLEEESRTV